MKTFQVMMMDGLVRTVEANDFDHAKDMAVIQSCYDADAFLFTPQELHDAVTVASVYLEKV